LSWPIPGSASNYLMRTSGSDLLTWNFSCWRFWFRQI